MKQIHRIGWPQTATRPGRLGVSGLSRPVRGSAGRGVSALFFFPRGGASQVARSLCRALPAAGWRVVLATGSLGGEAEPTHAETFFAGIDTCPLEYSPTAGRDDHLTQGLPFQPSYEDRAGA